MKKLNLNFKQFLVIILVSFCFTSCVTKKDVVYFQNAKDFETMVDTDTFEAKLKIGDIVSVYISTLNPELAQPYNVMIQSGSGGSLVEYIIDVDGNIDFPVLGKVKLLGLTVEEAKELFKKKFKDGNLLKDPVVIIRILNYRVTITGAVNSPGVYEVPNGRVTILEALGMAGDLNINGKRDNVLVIRNQNGTKVYTRVDLTSKEIFNSPVFYLTQNDYIYVEPNNSAISSASGDRRLNTIMTITSFLLTTTLIFVTVN
ncbi:sugar transporter [Tamlana nanhaiensis]|uniref:Sugar transporter n=1 Tax=Neotamlana nanhaiensis TaxID=1382798 RepID=A0A0D7W1A9_9FLAO|nr:polysaccharide biosynthesis/export family protein [Tamlana nanhaiensis]KJD32910.1 sugar transporter [Tamlana nanhaiensis]